MYSEVRIFCLKVVSDVRIRRVGGRGLVLS